MNIIVQQSDTLPTSTVNIMFIMITDQNSTR